VTERDYQARMNRLTRLAFHLGDEAAANEAIALAGRAGDHATGRRLLARFDREGVSAAVGRLPSDLAPIIYRGIALDWTARTAILLTACMAEHVLPLFESDRPRDFRPRDAISMARRRADEDVTAEELRLAHIEAHSAGFDAGAYGASHAAYSAAEPNLGSAAGNALAAVYYSTYDSEGIRAASPAREREREWQHARFLDLLLDVEVNCD